MEIAGIQKALDDIRGEALVFHGFTDYMRDYDLIVFRISEAQAGHPARHVRYLFHPLRVGDGRDRVATGPLAGLGRRSADRDDTE